MILSGIWTMVPYQALSKIKKHPVLEQVHLKKQEIKPPILLLGVLPLNGY
tara:strand:- start:520 stop:669 length:150 start_codon:yes stop_codon:yes gene_type:complete